MNKHLSTRIASLQNTIFDIADEWPRQERPRLVAELRAIADTLDEGPRERFVFRDSTDHQYANE